VSDCTNAIRLNPKDAVAFNNRGKAWFDKGESNRAIADCDEAIRLDRKDAVAFYDLGRAWRAIFAGELALMNGGRDDAKGLFRLAAAECPHNFLQWSAATAELRALSAAP
jgi:tetratricopeptide (TPR) repeat protein